MGAVGVKVAHRLLPGSRRIVIGHRLEFFEGLVKSFNPQSLLDGIDRGCAVRRRVCLDRR